MRSLRVTLAAPATGAYLAALAEGLTGLNIALMRASAEGGAPLPLLYESGVVYRREPRGEERWLTAPELLARGAGDCEDLSAYRAAELRHLDGEPAVVEVIRNRRGSFHAVVRRADGALEDPSRILLALESRR